MAMTVFTTLLGAITIVSIQAQKRNLKTINNVSHGFKITTRLENENKLVQIGQPILLVLNTINDGNKSGFVIESSVARDFNLTVKNEYGKVVPLTEEGRRLTSPNKSVYRNKKVKLEPGESIQSKINLAHLYEMTAKGTYYANASRIIKEIDGDMLRVESNTIQFVLK